MKIMMILVYEDNCDRGHGYVKLMSMICNDDAYDTYGS